MMKFIIVAILLVGLALGDQCSYDDAYYFDSSFLNTTDYKNDIWYFTPCPLLVSEGFVSPCPSDSAVCVLFNGADDVIGAGLISTYLVSYVENGVELVLGSDSVCMLDPMNVQRTMKTTLQFFCSYENSISVQTDGCFTVITVNSSNCNYADGNMDAWVGGTDSPDAPMNPEVHHTFAFFSLSFILLFSLGFMLSLCMCCCCLARRRRCQQRKEQAMRQFSNLAFQPIPLSQPSRQVSASSNLQQNQLPLPSFNPYLPQQQQQQQFVYYYPSQFQAQFQQVPLQTIPSAKPQQQEQDDSDEKLAKQLQAQFDQEATM